jgi:uncharacterized membrane protein
MSESTDQTLAVFLFDDPVGARRFLTRIEEIDKLDRNVSIADAAIVDRTKHGRVKVHQTRDRGAAQTGARGAAIGVVIGTILFGPAGPAVAGAAGGVLAGLYGRFRDIGIDDGFMRQVASEIDKGKSALFVEYEGDWSGTIGTIKEAVAREQAQLIQSTLPAAKAAELQAIVMPAIDELGGEEVVADYEVELEPAESAPEPAEPSEAAAQAPDVTPAKPKASGPAAPRKGRQDDLTQLNGIGPKAAAALEAAGIKTYAALAKANEPKLRAAVQQAGIVPPASLGTWPMQASFAAKGDWQALNKYNAKSAGSSGPKAKAAKSTPTAKATTDDLTQLSGIGRRMSVLLGDAGISTYDQLQHTSASELRVIVAQGGALPSSSLESWPTQASYAASGDWEGLAAYNKGR